MQYPYNNFYEAVANNARQNPKKTLLFFQKQKISNEAFKKQVDIFAGFLEISGIEAGDRVAIIMGNSIEFAISFFAITKIKAIAVPINNFLTQHEFEYILNDCSAKMLITQTSLATHTQKLQQTTTVSKVVLSGEVSDLQKDNYSFDTIISHATAATKAHENATGTKPTLEDTACIVYTSGTTGKPKGAMLSYKGILSNAFCAKEVFDIHTKDRFLLFLPMFHSFTLSIMLILPVVTNSSIIVIRSVFPFANVLKQALFKRATVFLGVPTLYNALVKAKIPWYFRWFHCIRVFISGSAPLSEDVINRFHKKFTNAQLLEGYGLSECSPAVSVNRIKWQKPLSVGLPFPGYAVKIVDDEEVEVAVGEVGEIIVKGDCVMQGYINRPEATKETISNGWLKTGDLGKLDSDGFLYIVDRKKDLIISKGLNIYPREIEEELYKVEGVEAAAVIGIKDSSGDEKAVAFIQLVENASVDELQIKQYLKTKLSSFKIPKKIHFVDELPKNAMGKVLKRVLKEQVNG